MLEESQYHCLADAYLESMAEAIEEKDESGVVDVDVEDNMLTLTLEDESQYVISKHLASQQIWLSSPITGGLHFSYNEDDGAWELESGQKLSDLLSEELLESTGIEFELQA